MNHINYSDSAVVHEATTPWVESVNSSQFTACVTRAGRNDYPADSFATVDWVAYQGAPSGGVAGEEIFSRWWTGTSCKSVTLPKVQCYLATTTTTKTFILYSSQPTYMNNFISGGNSEQSKGSWEKKSLYRNTTLVQPVILSKYFDNCSMGPWWENLQNQNLTPAEMGPPPALCFLVTINLTQYLSSSPLIYYL